MEGQPDEKLSDQDRMDDRREPAEDEWKSWQRGQVRNTLHLVSAAAQWILLLACLIYLGISSLQPSMPQKDEVAWTYISYTGESVKGTAVNLTAEAGSIQIRNGSIMVPCDGLYLMSLEGNIHFPVQGLLKLTLMKTDKKPHVLWEQTVEESGSAVSLVTVLFLFQHDNITLLTSSEAIISLSFSLVLLSPVDDNVKCQL
ncbi:tumor necrosis factor ligand superfamily member 4 [Melanerpes formicivorus]|uniref:tumor necrosis factor ligand superfamily member 4 n=1 Tax=Melanerpes formicivorus TaxID=211600 RepID=UPI00358FA427